MSPRHQFILRCLGVSANLCRYKRVRHSIVEGVQIWKPPEYSLSVTFYVEKNSKVRESCQKSQGTSASPCQRFTHCQQCLICLVIVSLSEPQNAFSWRSEQITLQSVQWNTTQQRLQGHKSVNLLSYSLIYATNVLWGAYHLPTPLPQ